MGPKVLSEKKKKSGFYQTEERKYFGFSTGYTKESNNAGRNFLGVILIQFKRESFSKTVLLEH